MSSGQTRKPGPIQWPCRFETDMIHFEGPPTAFFVRKGLDRPFHVLINESVFQEIRAEAHRAPNVETLGLLIGEHCEDPREQFTLIEGALKASSSSPGEAVPPAERFSWARLEEDQGKHFPSLKTVGWYCCRPGSKGLLTAQERNFHSVYFFASYQVVFLYDTASLDCGIFSWNSPPCDGPSALSGRRGFYLYRPTPLLRKLLRFNNDRSPALSTSPTAKAHSDGLKLQPEIQTSDGTRWSYRPHGSFRSRSGHRSAENRAERGIAVETSVPAATVLAESSDRPRESLVERTGPTASSVQDRSNFKPDFDALRCYLGEEWEVSVEPSGSTFPVCITSPMTQASGQRLRLIVKLPVDFPDVEPYFRLEHKDVIVKDWQKWRERAQSDPMRTLADLIQQILRKVVTSQAQSGSEGEPEIRPRGSDV